MGKRSILGNADLIKALNNRFHTTLSESEGTHKNSLSLMKINALLCSVNLGQEFELNLQTALADLCLPLRHGILEVNSM